MTFTFWQIKITTLALSFGLLAVGKASSDQDVVPTNNSVPMEGDKIVGGTPASANEYPYYAIPAGEWLCGASLVHEDILLTVAHCEEAFLDGIIIGGIQLYGSDAKEFISVESEHPHPDYLSDGDEYDIMLVKLERSSTQPTISWNTNAAIPSTGSPVHAIGFGDTTEQGYLSDILLEVDVDIVSNTYCNDYYGSILPSMLCAESSGKDTCQGDSGGPLIQNGKIVGIVSSGDGCARPSVPGIYTRVSSFNDFIKNGICDLSANPPTYCNDIPPPNPFFCFSPNNSIAVKDRGYVSMDKLQIGDHAQDGKHSFSRVYSFGHLDEMLETDFIQIQIDDKVHSILEVSAEHMVFVSGTSVRASQVQVGDTLGIHTVIALNAVKWNGAFAPLMESGRIMVSGVLCSSYVDGSSSVDVLHHISPNIQNRASHAILYFHRLFCSWNFAQCKNETYTDRYSDHLYPIFMIAQMVSLCSIGIQMGIVTVLIPVVMLLACTDALFCLSMMHPSFLLVLMMMFMFWFFIITGKKGTTKMTKA